MISTAKHKAKELVEQFNCGGLETFAGHNVKVISKKCALITVNTMIETVSMCIPFFHEYTYVEFWEEVKIEIEKL